MKLFRKVRQKLFKEGNIKRYPIYAIGEILLIMIGISLAFQLDTWNENRIKKGAEIRYYENIRAQIGDDSAVIQHLNDDFNTTYMTQFKYAIALIEVNDRSKLDTLAVIVQNMTQYSDFDRQGNIYETLVNSGEIKLLRNHDIVNGIRKLEEKYIYINRMEHIHYEAVMFHVVQTINPIIKFTTGEIMQPELVFKYEFQNLLSQLIQLMIEKDKVYSEALYQIDAITKFIDQELDDN